MIKPQRFIPNRFLRDRITDVADEASAFMRRRRISQRPYARVYYEDGTARTFPPAEASGRALFLAAARLIELAGE